MVNKVATRLAVRGALPKLLLGFAAMAVLLLGVTWVQRSLAPDPISAQSPENPPRAAISAQSTDPATAPTSAQSAANPAPAAISAQTGDSETGASGAGTAAADAAAISGAVTAATDLATAQETKASPAPRGRAFPKSAPKAESDTNSAASPLKALLIGIGLLAALVGLLFAAARFLRKARLLPSDSKRQLKLRDVLSLGPKKSLHVVGFEGRTLLIASAGESVTLIADYAAEELQSAADSAPLTESVPNVAGAAINREASPEAAADSTSESAGNADIAVATAAASVSAATPAAKPASAARAATTARNPATTTPNRPERVPAAFRHLLAREQGVELEA